MRFESVRKRCSRRGIANVARQRVPGPRAGKTERLLCHGKSTEWNEVVPARTRSQSHISTRTTQIHEVARRSTMHDVIHQRTQLVSYPTRYRKPVKLPPVMLNLGCKQTDGGRTVLSVRIMFHTCQRPVLKGSLDTCVFCNIKFQIFQECCLLYTTKPCGSFQSLKPSNAWAHYWLTCLLS